ncbi:hypothetical protein OCD70_15715 [Bacillus tropicus]|uniref:hypothetical protein n=1 Tax=Bacillus tropicus TaxID=2026188 RepID=UPI0021D1C9B9|nr:hypothetical protein [Bacillus tropicus]MCU5001525.1 hypothetical protein [Bacillus tropicus]
MTDCSSHRSWISFKAEAARSEQEGVGTPDYEALFASNEGVKQPTVLAAGAGYHLKAEAARSESLFSIDWSFFWYMKFIPAISQLYPIYQRFFNYIGDSIQYISDFSIISTYRQIKTISAPLPATFINILQSLLC